LAQSWIAFGRICPLTRLWSAYHEAMATKKKKKEMKAGRAPAKKRPAPAQAKRRSEAGRGKTANGSQTIKTSGVEKRAVAKAKKALKPAPRKTSAPKARTTAKKPPPRKTLLAPAPSAKKKPTLMAPAVKPVRRRDALGHLDPKYAADLRRQSGPRGREDGEEGAFLEHPRSTDDLAESFGEQFVEAVTSGEDGGEDVLDQEVAEERGGPFVESTGGAEFADGTDASNPKGAKREPFPTT
jgi:hypothetical protein